MQFVIYAATRCGYRVQVIDGGEIVHEYSAGNCISTRKPSLPLVPRMPLVSANSSEGPSERRKRLLKSD